MNEIKWRIKTISKRITATIDIVGIQNSFGNKDIMELRQELYMLETELKEKKKTHKECAGCDGSGDVGHDCDCEFCDTEYADCYICCGSGWVIK